MSAEVLLDRTDRILIDTVESAIEAGTGRTFRTPTGTRVRVAHLGDRWVRLEVMRLGIPVETLNLPRDIRDVARRAALLRGAWK